MMRFSAQLLLYARISLFSFARVAWATILINIKEVTSGQLRRLGMLNFRLECGEVHGLLGRMIFYLSSKASSIHILYRRMI